MNTATLTMLLTAVVLNTAAQFVLKSGARQLSEVAASAPWHYLLWSAASNSHLLIGLALYVASFGLWIAVLSKLDVSVAYPMLSLGYVLAVAIAYFWHGEPLTVSKVTGVALIVAGVYFLSQAPSTR